MFRFVPCEIILVRGYRELIFNSHILTSIVTRLLIGNRSHFFVIHFIHFAIYRISNYFLFLDGSFASSASPCTSRTRYWRLITLELRLLLFLLLIVTNLRRYSAVMITRLIRIISKYSSLRWSFL